MVNVGIKIYQTKSMGISIMTEQVRIPNHTLYEPCPFCQGTGKTGEVVKRPCIYCRGKGKLPKGNADGQFMRK